MTASTIIERAAADGVMLALSPAGTVKAMGKPAIVERWVPALREHKPEILAALEETAIRNWLDSINETDPEIIAHVLTKCRTDPSAREYYLKWARGEFRLSEFLTERSKP